MPRVVRNFWFAGAIDGRAQPLSGGPRARDGGMAITVYQRDGGVPAEALIVSCVADADGALRLEVTPILPFYYQRSDGTLVIETTR